MQYEGLGSGVHSYWEEPGYVGSLILYDREEDNRLSII